jgi:hypothetical protein
MVSPGLPSNQVKNNSQQDAENNAGDDRKVKTEVAPLQKNITGQTAQSEQSAPQQQQAANQDQKYTKKKDHFAKGLPHLAYRLLFWLPAVTLFFAVNASAVSLPVHTQYP